MKNQQIHFIYKGKMFNDYFMDNFFLQFFNNFLEFLLCKIKLEKIDQIKDAFSYGFFCFCFFFWFLAKYFFCFFFIFVNPK